MAKQIVITPVLIKKIGTYIEKGYMKNEIAVKLGVTRNTLYRWEKKHPEVAAVFEEEMQVRTELYKEEILKIANDRSNDLIIDEETGRSYPNSAAVARDNLRVKTYKDVMKYDNPAKFGDKVQTDITSNGETINGFGGLMITFPTDKVEEEDGE
jgi:transposase-like protein